MTEQNEVDDLRERLTTVLQHYNAVKRDRDTLERMLITIFEYVEFDHEDTGKVFIRTLDAKRYLPDRLANALYTAFDYVHGGKVNRGR
jgi:hypothetical protein